MLLYWCGFVLLSMVHPPLMRMHSHSHTYINLQVFFRSSLSSRTFQTAQAILFGLSNQTRSNIQPVPAQGEIRPVHGQTHPATKPIVIHALRKEEENLYPRLNARTQARTHAHTVWHIHTFIHSLLIFMHKPGQSASACRSYVANSRGFSLSFFLSLFLTFYIPFCYVCPQS